MSGFTMTLDVGKVRSDIDETKRNMGEQGRRYVQALSRATYEFANDMIAEAQQAAAVRTGNLRGAATVEEPVVSETAVTCRAGFNIKYGRQRDQGGTIYPSKANMLAIPLDPILTGAGVPRFSSPREEQGLFVLKLWGRAFLAKRTRRTVELHWVLKDHVDQKGDGFFSKVVNARKVDAAAIIGLRTRNAMNEAGPSGPSLGVVR